ncbi:MAG: ribonuclease H-like domain-containing protein [Acidobacteria bacterium]|nr:ribonuclease H-like domain-containing protein [Acidobacteriota bacterium]
MSLAERLRAVVRPAGAGGDGPSGPPDSRPDEVAAVLGGEWREARGRSASADRPASAGLSGRAATRPRYLVIDRTYPAGHRLGRVAVADCLPAADGVWPRLELLMCGASGAGAPRGRLLFVDLETTGLAGGAGTYAFLVGFGWFEGATFRVRQFFLASYAAERGLLEDVAGTVGAAGALVTYNGKAFDVPLIDTRFLFHRMEAPFSNLPHLDMLHPARRLWRSRSPWHVSAEAGERQATCRLTLLEQAVLGHVREGDVPGFEIPSRYFHYVRTGDARPLGGVLEHNRLDLLALAMLTARAVRLLEEGAAGARTAREALGLGRLYERGGLIAQARASFARAAEVDLNVRPYNDVDPLTPAEALHAYAVLCRRARRYGEAAEAWRRVLGLRGIPAHMALEATEGLAVHHEHRLRDLRAARQFAMEALQFNISATRVQAVHHRLARIDRKLGRPERGRRPPPPPRSAPLF